MVIPTIFKRFSPEGVFPEPSGISVPCTCGCLVVAWIGSCFRSCRLPGKRLRTLAGQQGRGRFDE